tara:strand:- start:344 stop:508 length:165 start_codon:yes stop_codon:yes gene_type:complete
MNKKGKHSLKQIDSFRIFPHGRQKLRYSQSQSSLSIHTPEQVKKYYEEKGELMK